MASETREVVLQVPGDQLAQVIEVLDRDFGLSPVYTTLNYPDKLIFISYRREDSEDVSGRIRDRLVQAFGKNSVFKDVESIQLGSDWKSQLDQEIARCDLMLVLIGKQWNKGRLKRKLNQEKDFVRNEIATALRRGIPVIPLWVGRRWAMQNPTEDLQDLPADIQGLIGRQGRPIRPDPDFNGDLVNLIAAIKDIFDLQNTL